MGVRGAGEEVGAVDGGWSEDVWCWCFEGDLLGV